MFAISVEAGIVNIYGTFQENSDGTRNETGCFYNTYNRGVWVAGGNGGGGYLITLDASRSSSIYGNSKTITPLSLKNIFLIRY